MSKYHEACHNTKHVDENIVKCIRKNLKNRNDFVQTTKELYIPVHPEEVNPVYRHYFNTHFICEWKNRTDLESKNADNEYSKFSMDVDSDRFMKLPSKSSSFYWIPDQFSPWIWDGVGEIRGQGYNNHRALFNDFSEYENKPQQRFRKECLYDDGKKTGTGKPDYKILIK